MAEKGSDDKILVCQSPRKGISSAVYTLKAPNFFTLAGYKNKTSHHYSESFEFINSTWRFRFDSFSIESNKVFSVFIERIYFRKLKQRIFYEIELLDCGEDDYGHECVFQDDGDSKYLATFENKDPSYDKCDIITLNIHLIHVESTVMEADEVITTRSVLSLIDDLKGMLLEGQDHNLTFNVSGKIFRAHQNILRARSDVFRSMLTHDMLEKNRGVIDVPDCDLEAFEQLLFYVYTGKVETLDESIMFGLYYAADKYNIAGLKEECCEFIKKSLNNTNVCDIINLATKHSDNALLNCATNYFCSNIDDILLTIEWQIFMEENATVANELIIKSLKKIREKQGS